MNTTSPRLLSTQYRRGSGIEYRAIMACGHESHGWFPQAKASTSTRKITYWLFGPRRDQTCGIRECSRVA